MVHVHIIDSFKLDEAILLGLYKWEYEDMATDITNFTISLGLAPEVSLASS